jgi:hypothetical protein
MMLMFFRFVAALTLLPLLAAGAVTAAEDRQSLSLDNGSISVRLLRAAGTYSARSGTSTFIRNGKLNGSGGVVRVVAVSDSLGAGKAIEAVYPDGGVDRLILYSGLPFLCLRSTIRNGGSESKLVKQTTPVHLELDLGRPAGELRVLGTDGLQSGGKNAVSYSFLAVSDPVSRRGVAAGWLTHDRASGVVLSQPSASLLALDGRSEYGRLRLEPGQSETGETFVIGAFRNAHDGVEAYASAAAQANHVKLPPLPGGGYSTWYHARALDEKRMAELAVYSKEKLAPFGFQVLQIDDQWQISRRDFTAHKPDGPYPGGMKLTADRIKAAGLIPGLWLIPFGWDPARPVFVGHQDWFVHRENGELYEVKWAGTCLDMTHPDAKKFVTETVSRITRDWGYSLIKIDGLWTGLAASILYPEPAYRNDGLGDAVFHNPAKTNLEAYRDGMKAVREGAGPGTFILGCNTAQNMRTMGGSFGLVDSMRIGPDVGTKWAGILKGAKMGTRLYFFHRRVWYSDPDCTLVRKETLSLDQARTWASWIALSGQLNLDGDDVSGLPPERLEIFKRTMPNHGLTPRPVDLFDSEFPRMWQLVSGRAEARRDVIGLFNWDDKAPVQINAELSRFDLPNGGKGEFVGFDYWANEMIAPFRGALPSTLPPASCRIVALRPALDRPQVVSTSRHITQGVIDVEAERWNAGALEGVSAVVGGDDYELRIHAPAGASPWKALAAQVSSADQQAGVVVRMEQSGACVRVKIQSPQSRKVAWSVKLRK